MLVLRPSRAILLLRLLNTNKPTQANIDRVKKPHPKPREYVAEYEDERVYDIIISTSSMHTLYWLSSNSFTS